MDANTGEQKTKRKLGEKLYTKGKLDNNLNDGHVYAGGIVVANCYSSFLMPSTIKANTAHFTECWNEYPKIEQYEQYIEYCDIVIERGQIPLHFVQWREANFLPHL